MDTLKFILDNCNLTAGDKLPKTFINASRCDLYTLFADLGFTKGAEVGVQRGRNADDMLKRIPDLKLYLIEPYKNHPFGCSNWKDKQFAKFKREAHDRLDEKNVEFLEMYSEQAVNHIDDESLDFVYIDGDHTYRFAMMDIIIWERKVRPGGIISGHDYGWRNDRRGRFARVTAAVNDFTAIHKIRPWFLTDENADTFNHEEEGYPSFFWVKS